MSITVYHPKTGQQVPVYYPTPKTQPKPTLATGKVLTVVLFALAIVQTVALYSMNSQQYLITQPSISAISENLKK